MAAAFAAHDIGQTWPETQIIDQTLIMKKYAKTTACFFCVSIHDKHEQLYGLLA